MYRKIIATVAGVIALMLNVFCMLYALIFVYSRVENISDTSDQILVFLTLVTTFITVIALVALLMDTEIYRNLPSMGKTRSIVYAGELLIGIVAVVSSAILLVSGYASQSPARDFVIIFLLLGAGLILMSVIGLLLKNKFISGLAFLIALLPIPFYFAFVYPGPATAIFWLSLGVIWVVFILGYVYMHFKKGTPIGKHLEPKGG